jgi:hypothetical protein
MGRTQQDTFGDDRRVAQRRSVPDRRMVSRDYPPARRSELRRQSDVLEHHVMSPSSTRRLRRRSIDNWIAGGLGQATRLSKRTER